MPFWTFFSATFIGKALIKAPGQACFFTMLFTDAFLQRFIHILDRLVPDAIDPCEYLSGHKHCHTMAYELLVDARHQFHAKRAGSPDAQVSLLKRSWNGIMALLIGYFVVSCIEQFAQHEQSRIDNAELEEWEVVAASVKETRATRPRTRSRSRSRSPARRRK